VGDPGKLAVPVSRKASEARPRLASLPAASGLPVGPTRGKPASAAAVRLLPPRGSGGSEPGGKKRPVSGSAHQVPSGPLLLLLLPLPLLLQLL